MINNFAVGVATFGRIAPSIKKTFSMARTTAAHEVVNAIQVFKYEVVLCLIIFRSSSTAKYKGVARAQTEFAKTKLSEPDVVFPFLYAKAHEELAKDPKRAAAAAAA